MNKLVTIMILSLLSGFYSGFLSGNNMWESAVLSSDKCVKLTVCLMACIALFFRRRRFSIPRYLQTYMVPGALLLFCLTMHWWFSPKIDDAAGFRAEKELIRLATILVICVLCSTACLRSEDYRFLVYTIVAAGALLACLSIRHSLIGDFGSPLQRVDGYLRAGAGIVDVNMVGALLNIASMAAIAGVMMEKRTAAKCFFLGSLVLVQSGRFATFSTGSFLSFGVSIVAGAYLVKKYDRRVYRPYLAIVVSLVLVFACVIFAKGMFHTLFYRVVLADDSIRQSSIDTRIAQYRGFAELITDKPTVLLWGSGAAGLERLLGIDLHNSYLRPLAAGGILACGCFVVLCLQCMRDLRYAVVAGKGRGLSQTISIVFYAGFIGWCCQAATIPADTSTIQWMFFIIAFLLRCSQDSCDTNGTKPMYHCHGSG